MAYVLILIGAVSIFLGITLKISGNKPVREMTAGEVGKAGCKGYFKVAMIVGGAGLILLGILFLTVFNF